MNCSHRFRSVTLSRVEPDNKCLPSNKSMSPGWCSCHEQVLEIAWLAFSNLAILQPEKVLDWGTTEVSKTWEMKVWSELSLFRDKKQNINYLNALYKCVQWLNMLPYNCLFSKPNCCTVSLSACDISMQPFLILEYSSIISIPLSTPSFFLSRPESRYSSTL